jgi:hydrogenase maturation protease
VKKSEVAGVQELQNETMAFHSKKRVLVIGYGNPLRGDDALGCEIAGRLASTIHDETVEVLSVNQLTPELSEFISEVELVVFIDASHVGQPGSWKCQTVDANEKSSHTLGHHLTPMSLLAYAQAIFKASPRALLVSVAGDSFECRQELTPSVAAALPAVEQFVREQIKWGLAGRPRVLDL